MTLHDLAMGPGAYETGGGTGPPARGGTMGGAYERGGGAGPSAWGGAMGGAYEKGGGAGPSARGGAMGGAYEKGGLTMVGSTCDCNGALFSVQIPPHYLFTHF